MKYFMHLINSLLSLSIDVVLEKWTSDNCPALKFKLSHDKNFDFDHLMTMGGLKTTGLEKGVVILLYSFC